MSKYHARTQAGQPMCGTRGSGNRYNVISVGAKEWNELSHDQRCTKCAEKIRQMKEAKK
jgi:hypothetical protein